MSFYLPGFRSIRQNECVLKLVKLFVDPTVVCNVKITLNQMLGCVTVVGNLAKALIINQVCQIQTYF